MPIKWNAQLWEEAKLTTISASSDDKILLQSLSCKKNQTLSKFEKHLKKDLQLLTPKQVAEKYAIDRNSVEYMKCRLLITPKHQRR